MADTSNEHSGSRWEPQSDEQTTEYLAGPAEPTEVLKPAPSKRRLPKAAAAVAVVAAATIAGGAIGLALSGNDTAPASDTAVTTEQAVTPDGAIPQDAAPDYDRDGDGPHGFGHHGPGGHR